MQEFATFEERLSEWTAGAMQSIFGLEETGIHLGVTPTNTRSGSVYARPFLSSLIRPGIGARNWVLRTHGQPGVKEDRRGLFL